MVETSQTTNFSYSSLSILAISVKFFNTFGNNDDSLQLPGATTKGATTWEVLSKDNPDTATSG
jgi:hypothetical protein